MSSENHECKKIQDKYQTKHFGKSYFQWDIEMDSPGYSKPIA